MFAGIARHDRMSPAYTPSTTRRREHEPSITVGTVAQRLGSDGAEDLDVVVRVDSSMRAAPIAVASMTWGQSRRRVRLE